MSSDSDYTDIDDELFHALSDTPRRDSDIESTWSRMEKYFNFRMTGVWQKVVAKSAEDTDQLEQVMSQQSQEIQRLLEKRKSDLMDRLKKDTEIEMNAKKLELEKAKVRKFFKDLLHSEKNIIRESADKLNQVIEKKISKWQNRLKEPKIFHSVDCFAFFCGVIMICTIEAILLKYPQKMATFYLLAIFPLMGLRYITYHRQKYHYFMLDFCYFVQATLVYFLTQDPGNQTLYAALFVLSNGPLMWAIVLWRNSIVFHSLDKVTSSFIHILPSLVTYSIRWYPTQHQQNHLNVQQDSYITLSSLLSYPFLLYGIWQVGYLVKTEWIDREKLSKDEDLGTSLRHLKVIYKNTGLYTAANIFGPDWMVLMFVLLQLVFTVITIIPTVLFYSSFEAHSIYIGIIFCVSIWNGANYYVYKYAKHQQMRLSRLQAQADRKENWFHTFIRRGNTKTSSQPQPNGKHGEDGPDEHLQRKDGANGHEKRMNVKKGLKNYEVHSNRKKDISCTNGENIAPNNRDSVDSSKNGRPTSPLIAKKTQ